MFYKLLSVRSQSVGRVSASPGKTLHGLLSFHLRVLSYRSSYPRAPEAARGVDDGHDRDETARACVCRSWGVGGRGVFCEQVSGPVVSRSVGTGSGTKPLCSFVSEASREKVPGRDRTESGVRTPSEARAALCKHL